MAREDRTQAQHLTYFADAAAQARQFGLFSLVRGAEARALELPRVGSSKQAAQNIVDLSQNPSMGFADSTLTDIRTSGGRTKVRGLWLGLTGTMGPLPMHLTEFAFYEKRYATSQPFGDWLDVLAGRMLQLFYRAWADSQPAAMADRPEDDRFAGYLSALSGAMDCTEADDAFMPRARTHYAALFSGLRSAVAIEDGLCHLLGQKVQLQEFQGQWRSFEPDDLSRLGSSYATLGSDAILGGRVRSAADAFRVVIRARNWRDYQSMLPTGQRFAIAAEALDAFKPSHLEWDICLEIADSDAPPAQLDGRSQLGWSAWSKRPHSDHRKDGKPPPAIRADAHLTKFAKIKRRGRK